MRRLLLVFSVFLGMAPALADAPERSLRPIARPAALPAGVTVLPTDPIPRPRARPATERSAAVPAARPVVTAPSASAVVASPRPQTRPRNVIDRLTRRQTRQPTGSVCSDPGITGDRIGAVPGPVAGCGIEDAVRITSVAGVRLSQPATVDCATAKALRRWVENGMQLSLRPHGQVVELRVAASYVCRTRNNQPGGRISEHGSGRAIDISGFVMDDGEVITVLGHWNKRGYRDEMRRLHRTACGVFGTVLGPESDRFHQDHFHFDTARHRNGPFCR
jgi:hypothetical protein